MKHSQVKISQTNNFLTLVHCLPLHSCYVIDIHRLLIQLTKLLIISHFEALQRLSSMYGADTVNNQTVVNYVVTRWFGNPFIRGSWSFGALG